MTTTTSEKPKTLDDDVFDKELDAFIEVKEKQESSEQDNKDKKEGKGRTLTEEDLEQELEEIEKGQKDSQEKKIRPGDDSGPSDNEDSEPDDYHITDVQKRAMEELAILKNELGYDDPPVYDVTERLKLLNEELAQDETPTETDREHKVGFKEDPVSLVVPPLEYGEEENEGSEKTEKKTTGQSEPDDKSEVIKGKDKNKTEVKPKNRVLVERGGHFELVSSDDVKASDFGLPALIDTSTSDNKENQVKKQPSPPGKPRPSTANGYSRRTVRPAKTERPKSAGTYSLSNFDYNSPYGLTAKQKELADKQAKAMEQKKKDEEKRKKEEHEQQQREANEAFEYWLKKKKEEDRRKKIEEEDERKKNEKTDRGQDEEDNVVDKQDDPKETSANSTESQELEEAFKKWLKEKNQQTKKEKLLHRREEQEQHEGFYFRQREDCDKAYKDWLKHKNAEIRKARAMERQRARAHRLAARRARKSQSLARAIRQSQAFRYVDYYGYRF